MITGVKTASPAPSVLGGPTEHSEGGFAGVLAGAVRESGSPRTSDSPTGAAKPTRRGRSASAALPVATAVMPGTVPPTASLLAPAAALPATTSPLDAAAWASTSGAGPMPTLGAPVAGAPSFPVSAGAMPSLAAPVAEAPSFTVSAGGLPSLPASGAGAPSLTAATVATPALAALVAGEPPSTVSGGEQPVRAASSGAARPLAVTDVGGPTFTVSTGPLPSVAASAVVAPSLAAPMRPSFPAVPGPAGAEALAGSGLAVAAAASDAPPVAPVLVAEDMASTTAAPSALAPADVLGAVGEAPDRRPSEATPDSAAPPRATGSPAVGRPAAPRVAVAAVAPRALVPSAEPVSQTAPPTVTPATAAPVANTELSADVSAALGGPAGWASEDPDSDARGEAGVLVSVSEPAARVAAPSVSVTAPHTSESALPELPAPAVPDQLHLSVRDPLGDWTLDVRRHEHGLDLLFSAPGSLAPVVAGAEHDLRTLLASHGHSLASLDFQEQGRQGGREAPYTPEPSPRSANPGAQRATKRTSNSSSGTTSPGQKGINLNRVA